MLDGAVRRLQRARVAAGPVHAAVARRDGRRPRCSTPQPGERRPRPLRRARRQDHPPGRADARPRARSWPSSAPRPRARRSRKTARPPRRDASSTSTPGTRAAPPDTGLRPRPRRPAVQRTSARWPPAPTRAGARPAAREQLARLQRAILDAGARAVRPGGTLVYSTCTISPAENEQHGGRRSWPPTPTSQPDDLAIRRPVWKHPTVPRTLQTLPHRDRTDGFFIARLARAREHRASISAPSARPATSPGCARRNLPGPLPLRELPAALRAARPCARTAASTRRSCAWSNTAPCTSAATARRRCSRRSDRRRRHAHRRASRRRSSRPTSARLRRAGRRRCSTPGATVIHVDVMDGHFVPPITMGPLAVERDRRHRPRRRRAHRRAPDDRAPRAPGGAFAEAGADSITVHARGHAAPPLRAAGDRATPAARPGLALNPGTPAEAVGELLDERDMVALHDRQPGLGRPDVPRALARQVSSGCGRCSGPTRALEVDGGIDAAHRRARARRPARPFRRRAPRSSGHPTRAARKPSLRDRR